MKALEERLIYLGYKFPDINKGYAAIDAWEKQTKLITKLLQNRDRLEMAIFKRAMNLRTDLDKKMNRPITIKETAAMLRIPASMVWHLIDLQLLVQDGNGKIPLRNLREFFEKHGWWMLKNYRYTRRDKIVETMPK